MSSIVVFVSDLSMLKNEWGFTRYPFVPGHEVVGRVSAIRNMVNHLNVGQYVGLGWRARSCLVCDQCLSGHHNRCLKGEDKPSKCRAICRLRMASSLLPSM
jgi:alcohol/geraniol dehydrogenase (NADP+)